MESFCIIGLGKFGQSLALSLAEEGKQVMVIDTDDDRVSEIADFVTNAVIGDPTNESVMRASGVKDYDCAVVCFTGNIFLYFMTFLCFAPCLSYTKFASIISTPPVSSSAFILSTIRRRDFVFTQSSLSTTLK